MRSRRGSGARLAAAILAAAVAACAEGGGGAVAPVPEAPAFSASALGNYLAARQAERQRDQGSAARFILAALEEDPENFDLLNRAHTLLIGDGRVSEAVDIARRIVRLSAANPQANLTLALIEARDGDHAGALRRLEGLPITGVHRVVLPLAIAWLNLAQGRPAAALNALRAVAEVRGFKAFYDYHAALINDLAGRSGEAEEHYRQALEVEGGPPPRLAEAAVRFFERQGRSEAARAIHARLAAQNPDAAGAEAFPAGAETARLVPDVASGLAEALLNTASALRQENNGQLALTYARLALALVPDMPVAILLVAEIFEGQGQREAANALYARIPVWSLFDWPARLKVAQNFNAMGRTEEAIQLLEAMAAERADRGEPLLAIGQLLRVKERFSEAAAAYDRAILRLAKVEPRHWSIFYARGIALERAKLWPRAEADFKRALELRPEQPDVLNYLAYSWVEQGVNFQEAQTMLERAVQLRPNSGHIIDSLGWVMYRTGRYREATELLERAAELVPEDPVILDHLGDALWQVGRTNEAQFQWRRALNNKPEPAVRAEIERKLARGLMPSTSQRGS
ncbi:MAG: tetratricopeptide repeat protein [Pseudomonadota bacterium]